MREYVALRRVWRESRFEQRWYLAGIQTAMHNAWLLPKDHPPRQIWDFLPEDDRPAEKANPYGPFRTQSDDEQKMSLRHILFEAAARKVAADRQARGGVEDPEAEAQLDALMARDWTKSRSVN